MARVLIVDDETWTLTALQDELASRGHSYGVAGSVTEAEAELRSRQAYDGVIVDIILPLRPVADYLRSAKAAESDARNGVIAGGLLCRVLQQQRPSLPVVVFSVREEDAVRREVPGLPTSVRFFRKGKHLEREVVDGLELLMSTQGGTGRGTPSG